MNGKACCTPNANRDALEPESVKASGSYTGKMIAIPGGTALHGTAHPLIEMDGEGPLRTHKLKPFRIGETTVTNAEFAVFVEATAYVTEAERYGWSFVFEGHLSPQQQASAPKSQGAPWWRQIEGAYWLDVQGTGTGHDPAHPVVHVSWNDTKAFATWAGGSLPTEAQWEHAARGGIGDSPYPWGDQHPNDTDFTPLNIWQGTFPTQNKAPNAQTGTAPARSMTPNAHGLYNCLGNVWEWVQDPYKVQSRKAAARRHMEAMKGTKVLKGGSFLCHASYCHRYRIAAKTGSTPNSTTSHQGFRIVLEDASPKQVATFNLWPKPGRVA